MAPPRSNTPRLAEAELLRVRTANLGRLTSAIGREFQQQVRERLRARGHDELRATHDAVLMNIDLAGTRQSVIAERAGVTRQAVGQIVDDLERLGYVERSSDPDDGRAQRVLFTARGRALLEEGANVIVELEREWSERLASLELEPLRRALVELAGGLGIDLPG